jgi:hypothetical protein
VDRNKKIKVGYELANKILEAAGLTHLHVLSIDLIVRPQEPVIMNLSVLAGLPIAEDVEYLSAEAMDVNISEVDPN